MKRASEREEKHAERRSEEGKGTVIFFISSFGRAIHAVFSLDLFSVPAGNCIDYETIDDKQKRKNDPAGSVLKGNKSYLNELSSVFCRFVAALL